MYENANAWFYIALGFGGFYLTLGGYACWLLVSRRQQHRLIALTRQGSAKTD